MRERYLLSTGLRRRTYPDFENDPTEALMFFVDSSVNACEAATECLAYPCEESFGIVKEALDRQAVTSERVAEVRRKFLERADDGPGGVELPGCASCGVQFYSPKKVSSGKSNPRIFGRKTHAEFYEVPLEQLKLFRARPEVLQRVAEVPDHFDPPLPEEDSSSVNLREAFTLYYPADGGTPYQLHREFVDSEANTACLCVQCYGPASQGELPRFAAANKRDYGSLKRIRCPELSLVEHALIARVRLYHGTIKLGSRGCKPGSGAVPKVIKGNMICYPHTGPQVVAKVVPDMDKVEESFVFSYVGPKGESDRIMKAAMQSKRLRARASVVFWCVRVLKLLNPKWSDVELAIDPQTDRRISSLHTNLQEHAVIADDEVYQVVDQIVSDDTARVRTEESDESDRATDGGGVQVVLDGILLTDRTGGVPGSRESPEAVVLKAVAAAASGRASGPEEDGDEEGNETGDIQGSSGQQVHKVPRGSDPLNEFTDNEDIGYGAFATLFLLGEGVPKRGYSKADDVHYLRQHTKKFALHPTWKFYRFNTVSDLLGYCCHAALPPLR